MADRVERQSIDVDSQIVTRNDLTLVRKVNSVRLTAPVFQVGNRDAAVRIENYIGTGDLFMCCSPADIRPNGSGGWRIAARVGSITDWW